jgi:hypothetical protein
LAIGIDHSPSDRVLRSKILLYNKVVDGENHSWQEEANIGVFGAINTCAFTSNESRCAVSVRVNDARHQLLQIFQRASRNDSYLGIASIPMRRPMQQLRWQGTYFLEMQDATGNFCKMHNDERGSWRFVPISPSATAMCRNDIKWTARAEGSNVIVAYPVPLLSSVVEYLLSQGKERKRLKDFPPLPSSPIKAPHSIKSPVEVHTTVAIPEQLPTADTAANPYSNPNEVQGSDQDDEQDGEMQQIVDFLLDDDK